MELNETLLEKKWSFFFDLMDQDKNGKWNLKDFVIFSEKVFTIYALNDLELNVSLFMRKSRKLFNYLRNEIGTKAHHISKDEWIYFLKSKHTDRSSRFFKLMIYYVSRELFDVCDQNKDDYLSENELIQLYAILGLSPYNALEALQMLDINRDHLISKFELYKGVKSFFEDEVKVFTLFGHVYSLEDLELV